ncbi:unnamed protein product [Durusdinium trenchii]|uniref:Apple domain-containing protein n=1 Tax=Durusdinium trenchii TaxID=1381693 RepID=A0ABP0KHP8_9DINO
MLFSFALAMFPHPASVLVLGLGLCVSGVKDRCSCTKSGLECFFDSTCPGLGCGAEGQPHCRYCGDPKGVYGACPKLGVHAKQAKPQADSELTGSLASAAAVANTAEPKTVPKANAGLSSSMLKKAFDIDVFRCMAAAGVDAHPMEDDDIASLDGAIKYVHTEILTEHLQNPIRDTRKYNIDVVTRHRMKVLNPDTILGTPHAVQGEFGQFITYDFGKATNPDQMPIIQEQGDFVGIQPCTDLQCDPRYIACKPYAWLSLGNWCPNLSWDKKGTKKKPNPHCLKTVHGNFTKGGLCEHGFNGNGFLPGSSPTGDPGCIYTYGAATFVRLDDVVGITSEYCGKSHCKDWLDFRFNCSNRLPFWYGRCDPRANERRVEIVAHALGIPGALHSHVLVDTDVLQRACPPSKASSWSCVPSAALGFSGPYCTRRYNGVCDRCWIPGVKTGPVPLQKPWCPLGILESPTYKDQRIEIECKSNFASQHCCLYTKKCDGSSDPMSADLTDDGLALVASRKSTADMEQFLRRAAAAHNRYKDLPLQKEDMKWAAYFAWNDAPLGRTLEEALAEVKLFLTSEHPLIRVIAVSTTTTTTRPQLAGPTTTLPKKLECVEHSVSFAPIDMPGTVPSTSSVEECQKRCAKTLGCFHFSFLDSIKSCHLHSFSALPQANSLGWLSGPPQCWQAKQDKDLLIDKGHSTYVELSFACMDWGSSFSPALPDSYRILAEKDFPTEMNATLGCQKLCLDRKDCVHFTVEFPIRSCILVGKDALATAGIVGAISGPPKCGDKAMQSYYWELSPQGGQQQWRYVDPKW